MIFSFCHMDRHHSSEIWTHLEKKLPEEYQYPDYAFLETLDPSLYGKDFIMGKPSLISPTWNGENEFWHLLASHLPPSYSIPDGFIMRRQSEGL